MHNRVEEFKIKCSLPWIIRGIILVTIIGAGAACTPQLVGSPSISEDPTPSVTAAATDASQSMDVESTARKSDPEIRTEGVLPARLSSITSSWKTNWGRHTIDYEELLSGGPPRDGIPSIDEPTFVDPSTAGEWLADNEPVIALEIGGEARAYPLQILTWHEIVNDTVAGVPVLVTFCPLCNSALVFDRRHNNEVLEFGTSGLLRNSDLVMYDRSTESLWQQFTGEAIAGDLAGEQLTFLPSSLVGFGDFHKAYPDGVVLSRETGFSRSYGSNPYAGYDSVENSPFLFDGELDDRLLPMARVVTVAIDDQSIAYPLQILSEVGVINDSQAGLDLVVFHMDGTSSALDARIIAEAEDVGATGVFDRNLAGQILTFHQDGKSIVDDQTGSTWNILGHATDGELAGQRLTPIVHADHFWFSWAAFRPDTRIYK